MSVHAFYAELGVDVPDRPGPWVDVRCFAPPHDHDRKPSCGVSVVHGGFRCQACGAKGSAYDAAVLVGKAPRDAAELAKRYGLFRGDDREDHREDHRRGGVGGAPSSNTSAPTHQPTGCTLEAYAEAKRLPVEFLRSLGISDYKDSRFAARVLRIPYRDSAGTEVAVRLRIAIEKAEGGDGRFLWRKGSKPTLYGLDRLKAARAAGQVVLVEGESDAMTLWHHGIPAVGVAGASSWNERRDASHVEGIGRIFVVVEPDRGGEAVLDWLGRSSIRDRAWLLALPEDVSALHLDDPERFGDRFQSALDEAEPWRVRAAQMEDAERRELGEHCRDLAHDPAILDRLVPAAAAMGVTGEERIVKLVYLAVTSRLLERPVSVAVKGPSAVGKSFAVERTLTFLPDSAFFSMTGMSERALLYLEEPLEHRMLVIFEAEGMAGDLTSYIIRSLLSEGQLRYPTVVDTPEGRKTIVLEKDGPTGLVTTTTAVRLHPENETRLISVTATDTAEQTRAIFEALVEEDHEPVALDEWRALQSWLALGSSEVTIPYGKELARWASASALRLRRDFGALLGLVRAHTLLHQASRDRDRRGRIVATLEDYAVARGLVHDLVAESVQATVPDPVREVVAAVAEMEGPTHAQVARKLKIDRSVASRRINRALDAGYLRDIDERKTRSKLVVGDSLPEEEEIFPAPERLGGWCVGARLSENGAPPTPQVADEPPIPVDQGSEDETFGAAWGRLERARQGS